MKDLNMQEKNEEEEQKQHNMTEKPTFIESREKPGQNKNVIIIHSGANMIGGVAISCISEQTGKDGKANHLMLDFGAPMSVTGRYFGSFQGVTLDGGIKGLQSLGGLPIIYPNPYRKDLPRMKNTREEDPNSFEYVADALNRFEQGKKWQERDIAHQVGTGLNYVWNRGVDQPTVCITHYHYDHVGNVAFLDPSIPIATTDTTYRVTKSMQDGHPADWKREMVTTRVRNQGKEKNTYPTIQRPFIELKSKGKLKLSGFEVETIPVSHSALDSTAFCVTFPNGQRVLWTSDIRDGIETREGLGKWLQKQPKGSIDMAFIDGTNVGNQKPEFSEIDVTKAFIERFRQPGPHYVMTNLRNFERWANVISTAKASGRKVYVPLDIAYYLHEIQPERYKYPWLPKMSDFVIFLDPKRSMKYEDADYPMARREVKQKAERGVEGMHVIQLDELRSDPNPVILFTSLGQMQKCYYNGGIFQPKGSFTWSSTGVHDEKGRIEMGTVQRWLREIGFPKDFVQIHASGHFYESGFREFAKNFNGVVKHIYPIHTEHPKRAAEILASVCPQSQVHGKGFDHIKQGMPYALDTGGIDPYAQRLYETRKRRKSA